MCGRFGFAKPKDQIQKRFSLERVPDNLPFLYNISPSQKAPVVLNLTPSQLTLARFGLVPSWSKEETTSYSLINARSETIFEKPTYKRLIKSKRCIIPCDGYYEWQKTAVKKIPYRIILKNEEPFAMAGVWDTWGEGPRQFFSFSIITVSSNKMLAPIHDRMPLVLDPEDESRWLQDIPINFILSMFRSYPAEKMDAYPISTLVNSPLNNSEEIIKRLN